MAMSTRKINTFLLLKLPAAYLMGVRVKSINDISCTTTVKHRWINQNPFDSMFWAVQGMAAELATGAMVMSNIEESEQKISMLVANNKATFSKKATGRITFTCNDGLLITDAIAKTLQDKEGKTCWMKAEGIDETGDLVSSFEFEWTVRAK